MGSHNNQMIVAMYRAMKLHTKRYTGMRCESASIARDGNVFRVKIDTGLMSARSYVVPLTDVEGVEEVS